MGLFLFLQESESEEDEVEEVPTPKRPGRKKQSSSASAKGKPKNPQLKRKLMAYSKALINYVVIDYWLFGKGFHLSRSVASYIFVFALFRSTGIWVNLPRPCMLCVVCFSFASEFIIYF